MFLCFHTFFKDLKISCSWWELFHYFCHMQCLLLLLLLLLLLFKDERNLNLRSFYEKYHFLPTIVKDRVYKNIT
ncbi:MAG: hypothetical protein N7Q72_05145, partial [Spiroplasma sp. Tabriz.8]|nr:hypothetical protein [Spiroplasma sp. Tabriz.8]